MYTLLYVSLGARQIRALKVKCDNLDNGCEWTGELGELETHLQSCDYTLLPCTNKCKDKNQAVEVLRKDFQDHIANECPRRQYQCPHCKETGEYQEIITLHLQTCLLVTIKCQNPGCTAEIFHYELSIHQSTCDYEPMSCKYAEVGCEERPLRKDLKKHEEDAQLHLQIATKCVLQQQNEIAKLKKLYRKCTPLTFKVMDFKQKKISGHEFYSPPFYISPTGYKMCVGVVANGWGDGKGTHVSVYAYVMKGDNDESLTWPFTGTVTFELLNQLEDKNHYKRTVTFPTDSTASKRVVIGERASDGWGYHKFISHSYRPPAKNCYYLEDGSLIFRVTVQVPNLKPWLECI